MPNFVELMLPNSAPIIAEGDLAENRNNVSVLRGCRQASAGAVDITRVYNVVFAIIRQDYAAESPWTINRRAARSNRSKQAQA